VPSPRLPISCCACSSEPFQQPSAFFIPQTLHLGRLLTHSTMKKLHQVGFDRRCPCHPKRDFLSVHATQRYSGLCLPRLRRFAQRREKSMRNNSCVEPNPSFKEAIKAMRSSTTTWETILIVCTALMAVPCIKAAPDVPDMGKAAGMEIISPTKWISITLRRRKRDRRISLPLPWTASRAVLSFIPTQQPGRAARRVHAEDVSQPGNLNGYSSLNGGRPVAARRLP